MWWYDAVKRYGSMEADIRKGLSFTDKELWSFREQLLVPVKWGWLLPIVNNGFWPDSGRPLHVIDFKQQPTCIGAALLRQVHEPEQIC